MDEDFGLADLGVTTRSAALVEEQVLQEAFAGGGSPSGDGHVSGAGDDHLDGLAAAATAGGDLVDQDRDRVASKLSTVQQEIATMEAALEAAMAEAGDQAGGPAGSSTSTGVQATSPLMLQMAVMRDRVAGLILERRRLTKLMQTPKPSTAKPAPTEQPPGPGPPSSRLGQSGQSPEGSQQRQRPRFGARALARSGGNVLQAAAATAAGTAVAGAVAQPPAPAMAPQARHPVTEAVAAAGEDSTAAAARPVKRARTGTGSAATAGADGAPSPPAADGSSVTAGPLALVETEKDRLIRRGLLTPFDRLAGFERKVQTAPAGAAAATVASAAAGSGGGGGASGSAAAPLRFQAAGEGSLRHLGRAELRPEEMAALTRIGRPVGEVIAEAGRAALEAREGRHKAKFLEPEQLPQPERDVRRIPQQFWHQAASARKTGTSKRLRREATLPRAKPRKARRRQPTDGEEPGGKEVGSEGDERRRRSRREKKSRKKESEVAEAEAEGGPDGAPAGSGRRRRGRLRRLGGKAEGGAGADGGGEVEPAGLEDGEDGGAVSGDMPSSGSDAAGYESEWFGDGAEGGHRGGSDDQEEGDSGSEGSAGSEDDELAAAGSRRRGRPLPQDDDMEYDDADEDFFLDRVKRSRAKTRKRKWRRRRSRQPSDRTAAAAGDGGGGNGGSAGQDGQVKGDAGEGAEDTGAATGGGAYGHPVSGPDSGSGFSSDEEEKEGEDVVFEGGFRLPARVYGRLFDYQQTAVKWLWELHTQQAGGILGDEMGLGKTVQVIAYLAGLHHSGLHRPALIVCPATVVRQWLRELRTWWPDFRVVVLHESCRNPPEGAVRPSRSALVDLVVSSPCGVLLTTYEQLRLQRDMLLRVRWGVAVLDEGHKIRNPDSEITLVCKQLATVHRIIMSGSPIQNRLAELWSLFDFIFPGKLGTLPVFQAQFAVPIQVGGYANASSLQVTTAYRCAVVLRDLIAPYLLRRRKADVAAQLPTKTEQVLFCTLVLEQLELYRAYLASKEVGEILEGSRRALSGIDILRKICNHPDLLERLSGQDAEDYGNPARSGKLRVAERVLSSWRSSGHKALLFCQTQQMLDIVEKLVRRAGWRYHRMDGGTPVAARARLIDDFNGNPAVFVFLLTTKVGGLGVNLTGATRVMLYDPDWNPSTDIQARERAWRIGQSQPVTIYRLITAGTIEEKVYHRQIYKNFLTNKVLRDPRQKRFFTARDIAELFTLGPEYKKGAPGAAGAGAGGAAAAVAAAGGAGDTETARIFGTTLEMHDVLRAAAGAGGATQLSSTAEALRRRGSGPWDDGGDEYEGDGDGDAHGDSGHCTADIGGEASTSERHQAGESEGAGSPSGQRPGAAERGTWSGAGRRESVSAAGAGRGGSSVRGAGVRGGPSGAAAGTAAPAEGEDDGGAAADESRVLRDLFEGGAGIRGLLDHSKIEAANDPELIAQHAEAQRIAQRAAEALRRSRQACAAAPISTPTWTGRHGHAGAPAAPPWAARAGGQRPRPPPPPPASAAAVPQAAGCGAAPAALRRFGTVTNARMRVGAAAADTGSGGGGAGGAARVAKRAQPFSGSVVGARRAGTGGAAPSSAALLANLRNRQQALRGTAAEASGVSRGGSGAAGTSATGAGPSTSPAAATAAGVSSDRLVEAEGMAAALYSFLEARSGVAGSEELVAAFRDRVAPHQMPLFKQLLRQVAGLRRRAAGGQWVLKPEFRSEQAPAAPAGTATEGGGTTAEGAAGAEDGDVVDAAEAGPAGEHPAGGADAGAGSGSGHEVVEVIDLT